MAPSVFGVREWVDQFSLRPTTNGSGFARITVANSAVALDRIIDRIADAVAQSSMA